MARHGAAAGGRDSGASGIIGLLMLAGGGYLLLQNTIVGNTGLFGYPLYNAWGVQLTSGYALFPLLAGIFLLFYGRFALGAVVTACSAAAILFGIVAEMRLTFRTMSLFELLVILTLVVGGLGLLLRAYAADRRDATLRKSIEAEIRAQLAAETPQDALRRLRALDNAKER
jgi:uncharacterized protein